MVVRRLLVYDALCGVGLYCPFSCPSWFAFALKIIHKRSSGKGALNSMQINLLAAYHMGEFLD